MTTRIAIVGSRNYPRPDLVAAFVAGLPSNSVGVSGAGRGVDSVAEEAAKARGLQTLVFHADWENLGRKAGPIRNAQIVAHAERVVAFWDGRSRGTVNTLLQASRAGLPIEIFGPDGNSVDLATALGCAEDQAVFHAFGVENAGTATASEARGA